MTSRVFNFLAVCAVLCFGAIGCTGKSSAFPLSVQEVQQMSATNSTRISFEERGGEIFVSVIDKFGDSHVYKLELATFSKRQALDMLKQKQVELEKRP